MVNQFYGAAAATILLLILAGPRLCYSQVVSSADNSSEVPHITTMERELKNFLFNSYDPTVRPAPNSSAPVNVVVDVALNQISELDEKRLSLKSHMWFRIMWNDLSMRWDPSDFGGVESFTTDSSHLWTPDIVLYNQAGEDSFENRDTYLVRVYNSGHIYWPFNALVVSECQIVVTRFPFDDQKCDVKIGSWVYDGTELDLQLTTNTSTSDLTNYKKNGQWMLCGMPAEKNVVYYWDSVKKKNVPYPDITYSLKLKRRMKHYIINVIIPSLSIIGVGFFTFFLPVESGEKVSLVVTVLLALTVFLLVVVDTLPD